MQTNKQPGILAQIHFDPQWTRQAVGSENFMAYKAIRAIGTHEASLRTLIVSGFGVATTCLMISSKVDQKLVIYLSEYHINCLSHYFTDLEPKSEFEGFYTKEAHKPIDTP